MTVRSVTGSSTLVLVRHGQSQFNAEGRYTGWADPSLTAQGKLEAMRAGRCLLDLGIIPDAIVSSDLRRAATTADVMASTFGMSAVRNTTCFGLRERNFGSLTGQYKYSRLDPDQLEMDHTAESEKAFRQRIEKVVDGLIRPWIYDGQKVLVVSHSHVMREIARQLGFSDNSRPDNGHAWIIGGDRSLSPQNSAQFSYFVSSE